MNVAVDYGHKIWIDTCMNHVRKVAWCLQHVCFYHAKFEQRMALNMSPRSADFQCGGAIFV